MAENSSLALVEQLKLLPRSLVVTLVGVCIASAVTLTLSELTIRTAERHAVELGRLRVRLETATAFLGLMADAETAQRGYLITGDPRYLVPFDKAITSFDQTANRLQEYTPAGPLRLQVDELRRQANQLLQNAGTTIELLQNGYRADAMEKARQDEGREMMDAFRAGVAELERQTQLELAALRVKQATTGFWTRLATVLSAVLIFGLLATVIRLFLAAAARQRAQTVAIEQEALRMQRLVDARTMELSELSSHLQSVTEREKAELARNLHDELGGLLTAARMDLAWLQGATNSMGSEIGQKLHQLNHALTEAMDVKRRIVESLHPALLDHFGLPTALQNYFDETCKQAGLNCVTEIPEEMADLPQDLAIALFRVGQESLTNIIRHAQAKNVRMTIAVVDDQVNVSVRDDGVGFEVAGRTFLGSHGINGMRHRILGLGGTLKVTSKPGHGTQLDISVPRTPLPRVVPFADAAP